MLLRSIKLVNFRGIPDLQVRDLRESGVCSVALPAAAAPGAVADAVRFALLGRTSAPGPVMSDGAGYAWVEIGFRTPSDAHASVFRGVDRRGSWQVSLREDGGLRITSGADEVRARLEEILGTSVEDMENALLPGSSDSLPAWDDSAPVLQPEPLTVALESVAPKPAPEPVPIVAAAELADARSAAESAADAVRRALRARTLTADAGADFAELARIAARLRRERTDVASSIERVVGERERVRVRLRRVNEYRDQLAALRATPAPVAAAPAPRRRPSRAVEWALAACAVALLAILVYPGTAQVVRNDPVGRSVTGLGFIVACGSYLFVASRRQPAGRFVGTAGVRDVEPAAAPRTDEHAALAALRLRFADLGDADDPGVVDDLRRRIAALDDQAAPLQARLERVDDAIALADVEIGRASRSLRADAPSREPGDAGLGPDETPDAAATRVANLGDSIHQSCTERDALATQSVPTTDDAFRTAEQAFARLGALAADEPAGRDVVAKAADAAARGEPAERIADVMHAAAQDLSARSAARTELPTVPVSLTQTLHVAAVAPVPVAKPETPVLDADAMLALTGGRFDRAERRADGTAALLPPGATAGVPWDTLDAPLRARVALAARLRQGEAVVRAASPAGAPRAVVLDAWPEGFASDDELAAFAAAHAPSVTQIVGGRPSRDTDRTEPLRASDLPRRPGGSRRR